MPAEDPPGDADDRTPRGDPDDEHAGRREPDEGPGRSTPGDRTPKRDQADGDETPVDSSTGSQEAGSSREGPADPAHASDSGDEGVDAPASTQSDRQSPPRPESEEGDERNDLADFLRELVTSVGTVLLVGALLFAASGVWPPLVAVESGSMEPHMSKGDLVFVADNGRYAPGEAVGVWFRIRRVARLATGALEITATSSSTSPTVGRRRR
jgi:Signal peptidase I